MMMDTPLGGGVVDLLHDQPPIMERIRSQVTALERNLVDENNNWMDNLASVEKYAETRRGIDRNLDMQHQRMITESLDDYLRPVRMDHDSKSKILEEKRIRDDAICAENRIRAEFVATREAERAKAAEEAEKRIRDTICEENRIRAEFEATREAERAKAAEEAEKRIRDTICEENRIRAEFEATREAERANAAEEAEKRIRDTICEENRIRAEFQARREAERAKAAEEASRKESDLGAESIFKGSKIALKLAEKRWERYSEITAYNNVVLRDYQRYEQVIARNIRQICGSKENVRARADELINLIGDPSYPLSVKIDTFTEKLISLCEKPVEILNRSAYACCQVIVLVTSKVPLAMDILVAKLNRACIYTVPKYVAYPKEAFEIPDAYYKALGYREEEGIFEKYDSYLQRLRSYMKLYGALVQTEVHGTENLHGISQGWTWLACFLNALPANVYTAVALDAFLEMAGYMLYKQYGSQFKKILRIIDRDFFGALSKEGNPEWIMTVAKIRNYIDSNQFLREPQGWQPEADIESHHLF